MSDKESTKEEGMSSSLTEASTTSIQNKVWDVQPVTSVQDRPEVKQEVLDAQSEVATGSSVQTKPQCSQALMTSIQSIPLGAQALVTPIQTLSTCAVPSLPVTMSGNPGSASDVRSPSPVQPTPSVASNPETQTPTSGLPPDLKLIYFNKTDSELKSPSSVSLTNGVTQKMVQLPAGGNSSGGFAYVGTIIKQGKDISEGQKVLLTPVIKDGGRFILPRTGSTQVKPSIFSNSTSTPGQIILSQGQQPRRSFLIQNSSLSKELKSKVDGSSGGTMLPKVLPLPKLPIVVSSSRSNDITVTPLKTSKEDTYGMVALRDLPPLSPISPNSVNSKAQENDDALNNEGDAPRPIGKITLKGSLQHSDSPTSPISIPDSVDNGEVTEGVKEATKSVDTETVPEDHMSTESTKEKTNETPLNPDKPRDAQEKTASSEENTNVDAKDKTTIKIPSSIPTCKLFVSSQQPINNDAFKKLKGDLPGIKVAGSNGHFVRILSTTTGADARDLAGKHALLFRDGIVLGTLSKEQSKDKDTPTDCSDKTEESARVDGLNSMLVQNKVQKTFPLVVSPTQEFKNPSNEISGKTEEPHKPILNLPQRLTSLPSVINSINLKEGLQVKELSKEGAMLERSRKRKGAPLLRDCFRKTIAVKRLEPLPGAASLHPLKVIDWDMKSFVGSLPGSDIKFVVNSYGALQVYEGEGITKPSNPKPSSGGAMDVLYTPEQTGKDDIGRCIECECYGLLIEFIEERFCSISCRERNQTRKALITKRSLALTKENTSKKRRLFEMALNKTRPTDENDNNNKMKPTEPRHVKTILLNNTHNKEKTTPATNTPEPPAVKAPPVNLTAALKVPVKPGEAMKAAQRLLAQPSDSVPEESVKTNEEKKSRRVSVDTNNKPSTQETVQVKNSVDVFDWCEYLSQMRSYPAWVRLFKDAFPSQPNLFKVGHRLEAIDPQRPSLFCAVSVTQVKGFRIKLHFDGYGKLHDFWLNAESPNIFPCGFCHSHGIELEPPWGFNKESFNWSHYLTNIKARPAPPKCFIHKLIDSGEPNLFKVGMKLEAVDKKNSFLVCVSTVAAVVDHRILIHFDSWDDSYDYWTEYYSPNIHPVGWCQQNNYVLTPPNGQKRKNFSWRRYLTEEGAEAAPDSAFMVRPPIKFKKGSKLEAIDPRAPHLLRVATIKQVLPYQVHVVFDGLPDHFGKWFDDDSPDLHPIGWSTRTGHALTPPPKPIATSLCSTPGCHGDGNASSGDLENHSDSADCPYSTDNLEEENLLPDRLSPSKKSSSNKTHQQTEVKKDMNIVLKFSRRGRESAEVTEPIESNNESTNMFMDTYNPEASSTPVPTSSSDTPLSITCGSPTFPVTIKSEPPDEIPEPTSPINNSSSMLITCESRMESGREDMLNEACDKFVSKSLNMVNSSNEIEAKDLIEWDSRRVTAFVEALLHRATNEFYNNKVDGEGLLMLNEDDLSRLSFNELEASTIYSNIVTLRGKFALQSN